jgi:3-oxoadipate enol-lactonase
LIPHHEVTGDGPPLVLSNSLGATLAMWNPQMNTLSKRFRVIRYDTRGHGGSVTPPGPFSIDNAGADVIDLLNHLGIERTHFAGLSLGGMTGMWLGIAAPVRIDHLILMCTSPKMGPPQMWVDRARTVRAEGTEAIADATLGRWLTDDYRASHDIAWIRDMFLGVDDEGYASACSIIEKMDLTTNLGQIRAPTLVIAGAQDPATPPQQHAAVIAKSIVGARLEVLDGAHLINIERPDEVTRLMLEHLEG